MTYSTLWAEMSLSLDLDERLVWPDMYLANRHLYDEVRGVAYIIRNTNYPDSQWEWVYSHKLDKLLASDEGCAIEVVARQLVCRIRLPWNEMRFERYISEEQYNDWRDELDVVDIQLLVWDKEKVRERYIFDMSEFHNNRDRFIVRQRKYLTVWKATPERLAAMDVDPSIIKELYREI